MRQYRGKRKDNGEWVKGWVLFDDNLQSAQMFLRPGGGFVRVIPETVGQSTGKFDKKRTAEFPKGQEIFEGDIIGGHPHGTVEVRWDEEYACFSCIDVTTHQDYGLFGNEYESCRDKWEVIGDIHSNPFLLEQE